MQQTTNYALKKIELADSPPDITVINPNWDTIDVKLKELEESDTTHKAEDATILKKGHVQLSNAVTSTDETKAATPKAVKTAMDRADAAFLAGNSRKNELVDKLLLLDPSLPISYTSTWEEILNAAGRVSTGKKYASGTVTGSGNNQLTFLYPGVGTVAKSFAQLTDLGFNPNTVILLAESPQSAITILFPEALPISTNLLGRIMTTSYSASGNYTTNVTNYRLDGTVAKNIDGFVLPLNASIGTGIKYFAFE